MTEGDVRVCCRPYKYQIVSINREQDNIRLDLRREDTPRNLQVFYDQTVYLKRSANEELTEWLQRQIGKPMNAAFSEDFAGSLQTLMRQFLREGRAITKEVFEMTPDAELLFPFHIYEEAFFDVYEGDSND